MFFNSLNQKGINLIGMGVVSGLRMASFFAMRNKMDEDMTRLSAITADSIRSDLASGRFKPGRYLSSERKLAEASRVSVRTVRMALKSLEREGLVVSESRRGYRVLESCASAAAASPYAFVIDTPSTYGNRALYSGMLHALQREATRLGVPLLSMGTENLPPEKNVESLLAARAQGVLLDSNNASLLEKIRQANIPVVLVEDWFETWAFDSVSQDGFSGGLQAADWALRRHRRRFAFLGPDIGRETTPQALERFCGVVGGLARAGLSLEADRIANMPPQDYDAAYRAARSLLARPDRPDAIFALWQTAGDAALAAARDAGLGPGTDMDIVGWSMAEDAEPAANRAAQGDVATIVWSAADLARAALQTLRIRKECPESPVLKIKIPTRLRIGNGGERNNRHHETRDVQSS